MKFFKHAFSAMSFCIVLASAAPSARAEVFELGWPYPPNNLEPYAARNQYPPA